MSAPAEDRVTLIPAEGAPAFPYLRRLLAEEPARPTSRPRVSGPPSGSVLGGSAWSEGGPASVTADEDPQNGPGTL